MSDNIILKNSTEEVTKKVTYQMIVDGQHVIYTEYIDIKNKLIDAELKSANDLEPISDAAMMERVQEFIDNVV
jgi:hypothetical protein